jgi:hypothetical protein
MIESAKRDSFRACHFVGTREGKEYNCTKKVIIMIKDPNWIEFYKKTYNQFRENSKYSWDMVKFYSFAASAFITITLGALAGVLSHSSFIENNPIPASFLCFAILSFPYTMYQILEAGKTNFERECEHVYQQLAIVMKLEAKFNIGNTERLDDELTIFPKDDYYTPDGWRNRENDWNGEKQFVKEMMEKPNTFHANSKKIFNIFQGLTIFLFFVILLIGVTIIFLNFV